MLHIICLCATQQPRNLKMFLIASTFTEIEKEYFLKKLKCSHSYLEYGAGESTIFAFLEPSIKIIRSIETTFKWIETVNKNLNFTDKDVIIDYIDINSNENYWGYPIDNSKIKNWSLYQQYCVDKTFDLCLIDGRFRVSSFIYTYINAPIGCTLLIHDYPIENSGRNYYKDIEKIANKKEQIGSFAMFYKDEDLNEDLLIKAKVNKHACR
jgi:hypothetical protein